MYNGTLDIEQESNDGLVPQYILTTESKNYSNTIYFSEIDSLTTKSIERLNLDNSDEKLRIK